MSKLLDFFHKKYYSDLPIEYVSSAMQKPEVLDKAINYVHANIYPDMKKDDMIQYYFDDGKKATYSPSETPVFSPMTDDEKWDSSQPNMSKEDIAHSLYDYNKRNADYFNVTRNNKAKQDYFNYLDSPQYKQTAVNMWGNDADSMIEKQKSAIQTVPIVDFKNMNFFDQKRAFSNPISQYDTHGKQILNYTGNDLALKHELSHTTDAKTFPSDFWEDRYDEDDKGNINRVGVINPKYAETAKEYLKMDDNFKKWDETFVSDGTHDSRPTEIRAFVNTLRQQMLSDGVDWNKLDDNGILDYVKKYDGKKDTDIELQITIDGLKNGGNDIKTDRLKAIRELAMKRQDKDTNIT